MDLLSFILAACPAHFHFTLVMYWNLSVTLVLCLMMCCRFCLLAWHLACSFQWLISSFFTNAFITNHVWHPHVIAGKTHWLKTFLFRLMGRCLSRNISLYFPKTLHTAFILVETSCLVLFSIAIVCPRYL